jgi:uncharacterized protein DUF5658
MISTAFRNSRGTACLVLLALADLLLTLWLLGVGGQDLREGNPLAAWCLRRCGWGGLVALKVIVVGLACGLLAVVGRRRPHTARRVLALCCAAQGLAVLYSVSLAVALPWLRAERDRAEVERGRRLDAGYARARGYVALRRQLSRTVIEGRFVLAEAVAQLEEYELCRDPRWQRMLAARYRDKTVRGCLEAQLVEQIEIDLGAGAPPRQELLARLRAGLPLRGS